jgi:hypothetical protein
MIFNHEARTRMVDKKLKEKIEQKINETFSNKSELMAIIDSLQKLATNNNSFAYGIVIGRLYNSFYYQCRRILKREPTKDELNEFLTMLKSRESEFLKKLSL